MEEMSEDWENCCPLCMEEMDSTDRQLKPCRCGYQICVWCWNHIMEMAEKDSTEGRCPACRTPYDKEKIVSTAVSCDRLVDINERKQKLGKAKVKAVEGRKNLSNVRVIQRNLVYVVGIPTTLADEETLERREYFGQYGKILKISVSKSSGQSSQHSSAGPSVSVYVTYAKEEDALRCIQAVNGYVLEGKVLKACFGTTKYCNAWLKHIPCNNPDCLYLHDEGTREDSFTKEEMLAKYGSKNQNFHDLTHPPQRRSGVGLPPPIDVTSITSTSHAPSMAGSVPKAFLSVGNFPKSSSLPAAASWGSRSNTPSSRLTPGRSVAGPAAVKPKTSSGLTMFATSSVSTVSGIYASGQSVQTPCVNNYDGVKHLKANNTDEAQTSLAGPSRLLERTNSAMDSSALMQTEVCSIGADTSSINVVEFSSPGSNKAASHSRNLSDAEGNNLTSGTLEELKSVESSFRAFSVKFADAEDSGVVVDVLTDKDFASATPFQENCDLSLVGTSATLFGENSPLDHDEAQSLGNTDIFSYGGLNMLSLDIKGSQQLLADAETLNYQLENGLQKEIIETTEMHPISHGHLQPDTHHSCANTSDEAMQTSLSVGGLSILVKADHASRSILNISSENHENIQCNFLSKDPRSESSCLSLHSVTSEESLLLTKDIVGNLSERSLHSEIRPGMGDMDGHEVSEHGPINGPSEHELISDMFAKGFDLWTDGSPQDLAQLLFNGKNMESPSSSTLKEATTSWKSSSSKQSRFHFARQGEVVEETLSPNELVFLASGNDRHLWTEKHSMTLSSSVSSSLGEVSTGEQLLNKVSVSAESFAAPPASSSKCPVSAPPGFSAIRVPAVPPPGFSQHSRPPDSRRISEASQDSLQSLAAPNIYTQLEAANNTNDVEFIDPAIMAVGRGKLPAGMRPTMPFAGSSSLPGFLSQAVPLSQQPRPLDFDSSYQTHQERPYRSYGSMNSISQLGYSNQDLDTSLPSLFHSSFNGVINQPRLLGQYRDAMVPQVMMQDSVYGNGAPKLRFQHSPSWDDWNRLSDVNTAGQQSVNDAAVGQLSMSQISLDRVLQSRLEELTLSKDLGSKYYGDAAVPSGHDDQGPFGSARIGRYYL